jgi:hypothetical protein
VEKQELEAIWVPRIGSVATDELRRYRRSGFFVMVMPVVAGTAGVLIGTSTLGDVLGAVLAAVAAWYLLAFIRAQRRLAAAMSEWFGVRITGGGLPKMYPKRFDVWCDERGLRPAPKLRHSEQMLWSRTGTVATSRGWVAARPHVAGTLCITSERVMFVPARFGGIPIALPEVQQFSIDDWHAVELSDHDSTSYRGGTRQPVGLVFRGDEALKVTVDQADEALGELRTLLSATQSI